MDGIYKLISQPGKGFYSKRFDMTSVEKGSKKERPVPPPGIIPYITSPKPLQHIEWLIQVFEAELKLLLWKDADGNPVESNWREAKVVLKPKEEGWEVMHAEMMINGALLYISDDTLAASDAAPTSELLEKKGGRGFMCTLYVDDVKKVWKAAVDAKATPKLELELQFWGAWYGIFMDPFGYEWSIAKYADEAS
ncbi:hypothetical protein BSKO_06008 [Bryopsis sp. KO-2023]|nr:hypothetical protein BSKO_06008 [Bryopsis sp. KO-2023]